MPTYEYECAACKHAFERFQPITAKPVRTCPSCGARRVRRLLGRGGTLIFKGAGFYATDYRSESYKAGEKKDKPPAAPAAAPASGGESCASCKKDPKSCPQARKKE